MDSRLRLRLAGGCVGLAFLVAIAGCDLTGTPQPAPTFTPIVQPTATTASEQPTAVPTEEATIQPTAEQPTEVPAPTNTAVTVPSPTPGQEVVTPSARAFVQFAAFKEQIVNAIPQVKPYTVAPGLSNVSNFSTFNAVYPLSPQVKSLLEKYGFAAQFPHLQQGEQVPKQFYQLYESGRYSEQPVFVTTDSLLNVYHQMFDKILRDTETNYLTANLQKLNDTMLKATQDQYNQLKGTSGETAARRNLAYFAVASRLLNPNAPVPADAQNVVMQELNLINGHAGISPSPVMTMNGGEYNEDYGQYKPRGHYTRSEALQHYFQAMMWYGRITFRLESDDETRSAILLTDALQTAKSADGRAASDLWASIYDPTVFFVGGADDLTFRDYEPIVTQTMGGTDPRAVTDDAKLAQFKEASKVLRGPRINSMFVYITEDKETATKGLRMMGQRFTLDEYVFGQLIWRNVGDINGDKRWLPKGLDVPAAFGSQEAYNILDQMGETKYLHYSDQMQKVRTEISGLPKSEWTQNLYWSWLYTFQPLLQPKAADSGYPSFMTNDAWTRKDLNTVLGSWTELKHDTLLYAKQVMAEMGGGPQENKGYVEPEPEFYSRVAALVAMTRDGLESRGLIAKPKSADEQGDYNTLNQLEQLALSLKTISEKELKNQPLTADEYTLIFYYGGTLEHLTQAASDSTGPTQQGVPNTDINDQDAAVVADVATNPNDGTALEEGTGRIMEVIAVVPVEGKLVLARGGIYSQYEFVQPSGNRLTDDQWRQQLDSNQVPPLGDWKTFIGK